MTSTTQDGNAEMVIGVEDRKVVLRFKEPQQYVIFDPPNVIDVARALTDAAYEADSGLKPVGDTLKAELVERHRMKLTHRLSLMLNTLRGDKTVTNGRLAQQMIEACFREIF